MAKVSTIVVLASDLSGETGASAFEIDPATMLRDFAKGFAKITLDVTEDEGSELLSEFDEAHKAIAEILEDTFSHLYEISAGLKAAGSTTKGGSAAKASANGDAAAIREWAKDNGIAVADRGRIHSDVVAQYRAANGSAVVNLDTATPAVSWDNSVAGDGDVIDNGPTEDEINAMLAEEDENERAAEAV